MTRSINAEDSGLLHPMGVETARNSMTGPVERSPLLPALVAFRIEGTCTLNNELPAFGSFLERWGKHQIFQDPPDGGEPKHPSRLGPILKIQEKTVHLERSDVHALHRHLAERRAGTGYEETEQGLRIELSHLDKNTALLILMAPPAFADLETLEFMGRDLCANVLASGLQKSSTLPAGAVGRDLASLEKTDCVDRRPRPHSPPDPGDTATQLTENIAAVIQPTEVYHFQLPMSCLNQVTELARTWDADICHLFRTAFQALLSLKTDQHVTAICEVVSGQRPEDAAHATRKIPVAYHKLCIEDGESLRTLVTRAPGVEEKLDTDVHGRSHEDSVATNSGGRLGHLQPPVDGTFEWIQIADDSTDLDNISFSVIARSEALPSAPLALSLQMHSMGIVATVVSQADRFPPGSAEYFGRHYTAMIDAMAHAADTPIESLSLLSESEHYWVTEGWNQTQRTYKAGILLHQLFGEQAERTPDAPAVVHHESQITYAELGDRSNRFANYLLTAGAEAEDRFTILLPPSIDYLVAVLAVLKVGGVFHPLATDTPPGRVQQLVEALCPRFVISSTAFAELLCHRSSPALFIDSLGEKLLDQSPVLSAPALKEDSLAYIIYTSGSTGIPKGVMVPHGSISNTLQWRQSALPLCTSDRLLLTLSPAFDASILQFFQPLISGACLVIPERDPRGDPVRIIEEVLKHRITILGVPPSQWRLLLDEPDLRRCESVRLAFSGGEKLCENIPERLDSALGIPLNNMYGPTEAAVEATHGCFGKGSRVSLGRPIANVRTYILDDNLKPVPVGFPGELYLAGKGLARGYLEQPIATAERFLPDPFQPSGARMYRTGDRCRWCPDGSIDYIGRLDFQVKIRGHRIELGEIEATLLRHPQVAECVVIAETDTPGKERLIAYVAPRVAYAKVTAKQLRDDLAKRLPGYMVPSVYTFLESVPRGHTGKPDRRALPPPENLETTRGKWHEPPQGPLEGMIGELFEKVLGISGIGRRESFFDLGGQSIQVAILARNLEERLQAFVYSVAVYDAPTIAELSDYLRRHYRDAVERLFGHEVAARSGNSREGWIDERTLADFRNIVRSLPTEMKSAGTQSRNPSAIFVLSPPRSGSTLSRIMLGGHPQLFAPPELVLLNYNSMGERRRVFASDRDSFWLQGLVRAVMEARTCDENTARSIISTAEQEDLSVRDFYRMMQGWIKGRILVEKTPHYALDLNTLQRAEQVFTEARYIHLIRHPGPMISSFEEARLQLFFPPFLTHEHPFETKRFAELIWNLCHENIRAFLSDIPLERKYEVRFEDLVQEPEHTMKGVASFLGIPYDPAMADPYREKPGASRMSDASHKLARMIGDVKFASHGRIRAEAAERRHQRVPDSRLSPITRRLAARLGYHFREDRARRLVPIQHGSGTVPLFCVHPAGGSTTAFREMAMALGSNQAVYAFGSPLEGPTEPFRSVEDMAAGYLSELRDLQPEGPYQLFGWSFGGLVAFEMALQLERAGEEVGLLGMASSYLVAPDVALRPVRLRDFAFHLLREQEMIVSSDLPAEGSGSREVFQLALDAAKKSYLIKGIEDQNAWRRLITRTRLHYRNHVRAGRGYTPSGRLARALLFDAENKEFDGEGPFIDWTPFVENLTRLTLPGDHFSMMKEPNVSHLAAQVRANLSTRG